MHNLFPMGKANKTFLLFIFNISFPNFAIICFQNPLYYAINNDVILQNFTKFDALKTSFNNQWPSDLIKYMLQSLEKEKSQKFQ